MLCSKLCTSTIGVALLFFHMYRHTCMFIGSVCCPTSASQCVGSASHVVAVLGCGGMVVLRCCHVFQVVILSVGTGLALVALVARYLRRRKRRAPRKSALHNPDDPSRTHRKVKPITIRSPSGGKLVERQAGLSESTPVCLHQAGNVYLRWLRPD